MTWYYAENGRQVGPVEEAALDDLVRQGAVRDETLVWREGMANWQPLNVARPRPAAPPPPQAAPAAAPAYAQPAAPPPQAAEMRYCAECGRPFPAYELSMVGASAVCAACKPAVMQRMSMAPPAAQPMAMAPAARHYGGFWIRFLAIVIDGILLAIVGFIIRLPLTFLLGLGGIGLGAARDPGAALAMLPAILALGGISFVIQIALSLIYEVYFLSTRGATPGKIALGLKVIRADGGSISAGLAAGRFFARWVSNFTLLIGYIIAGFDSEKRSLHDRICETRVIYAK